MSKRYQAAILSASYNGLKVPNAPTIGTATAGAGSASVTFTAPSNTGGGAITSYTVISSPGSITASGSSSPISVTGLTNGTAYTFTVVATNSYGSGPASAASNSVTPSVNYIEDVFSTYLYTGTGSSQTINNGIDLAGKGGLAWLKIRSSTASHFLVDTVRGGGNYIVSNSTAASSYNASVIPTFNSNGFDTGGGNDISAATYASWTFRKQPKFFDVVTFTSNSTGGATINHSLGSAPGCVIVKSTAVTGNWFVYHIGMDPAEYLFLNTTAAAAYGGRTVTTSSTQVTYPSGYFANSTAYVAYLFAHNAGGFGLTGTDNVISCGTFTTNPSGGITSPLNLGYEPQWFLIKRLDGVEDWNLWDSMRGFTAFTNSNSSQILYPNKTNAEGSTSGIGVTSTGVNATGWLSSSSTYIYVAIRRGPMKVPTSGTSVFTPVATTASAQNVNAGFPVDAAWLGFRTFAYGADFYDRLRGITNGTTAPELYPYSTAAEYAGGNISGAYQTGIIQPNFGGGNQVWWMLGRAPGFFDEVCYTGNGSTQTITHNLGVAPELIIAKNRGQAGNNWPVLFNFASTTMNYGFLNLTNSYPNDTYANVGVFSAAPTSTSMFLVNSSSMNASGYGIVAYLFATCPGVSKVGSYTGNNADGRIIDCGFTTGARFVLIKRTDQAGQWAVWDSARGITSGNDPYLMLNNTSAEVTGYNDVDSHSTGFKVNATSPGIPVNVAGSTYIFLAIA